MSDAIEVHVTELDWFFECPHRWMKQKVEGTWQETNSRPFMRGRAVHKARERALTVWKEAHEWPGIEALREEYRREIIFDMGGESAPWDPELEDYYWEEPESGEQVMLKDICEEVDRYVRFDHEHVLPRYAHLEMVAVEERWHVPIEDPELKESYVLTGKIDLLVRETASGRLALHDLKTGSKIQQEDADLSPQLSGYSAGVHALYGEWPLHALGSPRFLKSAPKEVRPGSVVAQLDSGEWGVYETVTTDRNPEDVAAYLRRLKMFLQMREAGWFPPAKGGFMSPCPRCPHAFKQGGARCEYASSAGGKLCRR